MIFTESRFAVFLALVWTVHWALRGHRAQKVWLLLASCLFYGAWDVRFLGLMLATIVVDWAVALGMDDGSGRADERRRKLLVTASVVSNLAVLGFFKYCNFFLQSTAAALRGLGLEPHLPTLEIVLPVGISFYTFQSLSYTIDVYRRTIPARRDLLDFALFVSFFPQLVAGPIVRASDFIPQLDRPPRFAAIDWRRCALLFLVGFVKKAVVADHVASVVDPFFAAPGDRGAADAWLAATLWTVQLYCDFSGYSDMAIALAGAFGYRLTRNFDFPFLAKNVADYRRRWHVSLTTWFRDYLYIPLGGARGGAVRQYAVLFTVFLLAGLWHGAAWTYAAWGLLYGLALLLERAALDSLFARLPSAVSRLWTFCVVSTGAVLFRSQDFGDAREVLGVMWSFQGGDRDLPGAWWLLVAAFGAAHVVFASGWVTRTAQRVPWWAFAGGTGVAAAAVLPWVAVGAKPFIYFQF